MVRLDACPIYLRLSLTLNATLSEPTPIVDILSLERHKNGDLKFGTFIGVHAQ